MCASLCSSNGQPAIQAKYTYSTLLPAFLFGCVDYASATTDAFQKCRRSILAICKNDKCLKYKKIQTVKQLDFKSFMT
jgi:hypothetical protein